MDIIINTFRLWNIFIFILLKLFFCKKSFYKYNRILVIKIFVKKIIVLKMCLEYNILVKR